MTDVYCIWNEYSDNFDIVSCNYEDVTVIDPVIDRLYRGDILESDLFVGDEAEEYVEGPYEERVYCEGVKERGMCIPRCMDMGKLPSIVNTMDSWVVLREQNKKEIETVEVLETKKEKRWGEEDPTYDMRTDTDAVLRLCKENGAIPAHMTMDPVLYDIYVPKGENRSIYNVLSKYSSLSHTAIVYLRWVLERRSQPSMIDLSRELRVKEPEGWRDMKKSELLGVIRKLVGDNVRRDFSWEKVWCPIETSKGIGMVNYGYIIENLQKKSASTAPPGRLLGKGTFNTTQRTEETKKIQETPKKDTPKMNENRRNDNRNDNKKNYDRKNDKKSTDVKKPDERRNNNRNHKKSDNNNSKTTV